MQRILAADIGGTNSRFGFFELPPEEGEPRLLGIARLRTTDASSFSALLAMLFAAPRPFAAASCDLAVLAVPGPVKNGRCHPPNIAWDIDLKDSAGAGLARGALLNDFAAQAYACRSQAVRASRVLQEGVASDGEGGGVVAVATLAVIGAGTGLGHCALVPDGAGGFLAVASEAGHAAFPFVGDAEHAYGEYLRRAAHLDYATGDHVVSGSGLARLHAYLTGEELSPGEVAARLGTAPQTLAWFARFYGRAARNYALCVLALGGVYVSGGVAAKNPALVEHPAFLEEFRRSGPHAALLSGLPVRLNLNEDSGVFGAAQFGAHLLRKG